MDTIESLELMVKNALKRNPQTLQNICIKVILKNTHDIKEIKRLPIPHDLQVQIYEHCVEYMLEGINKLRKKYIDCKRENIDLNKQVTKLENKVDFLKGIIDKIKYTVNYEESSDDEF